MKHSITAAVTVLLIAFNQSLSAQEEKMAKMVFYSELGGPGVIMSANFDSRFKTYERLGFGFRLGVGFGLTSQPEYFSEYGGYESYTRTYYSIPAGLNYVFGKPNSASTFEVGAGVTYLTRNVALYYYDYKKPGHVIGFCTFMYRRVPVNGGFSFRVGMTPIIGTGGDLIPMVALGFGYAF